MPTKQPRGTELTLEQQRATSPAQRRLGWSLSTGASSAGRIVQDRLRLWKQGVRDLVMARCCACILSGCV